MATSCRNLFLRAFLIILLHVDFSFSNDYDVTTLYKFHKTPVIQDDTSGLSTIDRNCSIEIHARNNARGLPFLSQTGKTLDPDLAVDIVTCTAFYNSCAWTRNNFEVLFQSSPLILQGRDGTTTVTTPIVAGHVSELRRFDEELSFIFSASEDNGELKIFLMDSARGLSEGNLYYFSITNRKYRYKCQFWECQSEYDDSYYDSYSSIQVAPGYDELKCTQNSEEVFLDEYWESDYYEFFVKYDGVGGSLTVASKENSKTLFSWTSNFHYYAIGTGDTGGLLGIRIGPDDDQPTLALNQTKGSIVSEAFIPSYNSVCVSVVYYRGPNGTIALQIEDSDGEKYDVSQLQTSSMGDGWESSIFGTELDDRIAYGPIRIVLSAEAPVDNLNHIVIQRIAGCNSKGLEDVYIVSSNQNATEMEFYAYDVAVNRRATNVIGNLECLNGGIFDSEGNSCICPLGFIGPICEFGCGPDRYDSKCSGHCSKTGKGCMEMKLCRPKLGCNCAPGIKGEFCDKTCSSGEYGVGCKQKCGKCNNGTCDIYTGRCRTGCEEGFYPPLCQTFYKHLTTPPKVTSIDYHTVQVAFSMKPELLEGSGTSTFYQIQIRDAGSKLNTWTEMEPVLLPATQSVVTNVTELNPGTNYELRVVLLDLDGNSYQGKNVPVANGFTKCLVPKVDYHLSTVKIEQKEFQIKWEYLAENILWCKLTHFEVELSVDWRWELQYEGPEKSFTFSDLLPGEKYQVRVRGVSVNGTFPFSEALTVITQDEAPETVYAPSIASRKHNEIEVIWKEPFAPRGKVQKYKVIYQCQKLLACNDDDCSYSAGELEVRTPSVTLKGLLPHAQYLISIAAKSALYGPEVNLLTTTEMAEPGVSPSLGASPTVVRTNSTLTVQWERPDNCTHLNGYLYGYQYELFEPKNPNPIQEGSTHKTSTRFEGLNPHTDYEVKVYLKTSGGRSSSHSLTINASTRATVPGKVEQLTVYKKGHRMLGLRWALPRETYGDITSFTISYRSKYKQLTSLMVKPTRCTAWPDLYCYTLTSLRKDTEYTVAVQARNEEISEDGEIAQVVAITKENAPLAADYIKIVSQTETNITIEWGLPKLINGDLKSFMVTVAETDSFNASDCCQYSLTQEIKVLNEQASYQKQLHNLKAASTYAVSVAAKTVTLGPPISITAHTRPPVPSMDGILEIVDSAESSELSISSHPTVRIYSTSVNQDLLVGYLLVVMPASADVSVQETPVSNEWLGEQIQQQINATFYIADELTQDDMQTDPMEVVLGKQSEVENGKWSLLWDPVLKTEQQYRIGLVAIFEYCGILNIGYTVTDILKVKY